MLTTYHHDTTNTGEPPSRRRWHRTKAHRVVSLALIACLTASPAIDARGLCTEYGAFTCKKNHVQFNDKFNTDKGVDVPHGKLRIRNDYKVPYDQFTHLDFQWGIEAKTQVYDKLKLIL